MIILENIILQRGALRLLDNASYTLLAGRKVGLIGANGSGKSSLFRLLLGELPLDNGELSIPKQWRIAHMAQEIHSVQRSALDFVMDGDSRLRELQSSIKAAELAEQHDRLAKLYTEMDSINGFQAKHRAEQLLQGLGFDQTQWQKPVEHFSGGWRIRLNLGQALMCPSDLLLLDEPTNHLDLDAVLWLEQWLKAYQGTLLLVSHDRDFLDNVVTDILQLERQKLTAYRGNYSAYERQRAERQAQQQNLYEKQQQRISEINTFVRRFKAKASKAKQAQSRLKELARMELIAPAHVDSGFNFTFPPIDKISNPLLELREAKLGYGSGSDQLCVLRNIDMRLEPGSRIGLLGRNGAGKSTLIKSLAGELGLQSGESSSGEHLRIGYFAQHQLQALDTGSSALMHIQRLSPKATEQSIRDFLGGFNFHGDKALQPIEPFSGGEKARLALAIIVWRQPNLLLLDEPTNHLDLEMRYALTIALQSYNGALVIISHDRHLLRNTVDEFYLLANGTVQPFSGTLQEYYLWLKNDAQPKAAATGSRPAEMSKKAQRQQAAAYRKRVEHLLNKVRRLEREMETAKARLLEISEALSDPNLYQNKNQQDMQRLLKEQSGLQEIVRQNEDEWIIAQEALEAAQ